MDSRDEVEAIKTDFTGKGHLKKFVSDSAVLFQALSGSSVKVPKDYEGQEPSFNIVEGEDGARLVFDMGDGLMMNQESVVLYLSIGTGNEFAMSRSSYSVKVESGKLIVTLFDYV